jgi:hypothetical protein
MLATILSSHAFDGATTQGCTGRGKVAQPPRSEHQGVVASWRSQIFMLACSRVIAGKHHNLATSPYCKNLTLLSVSNKGFAHRLARTLCLQSLRLRHSKPSCLWVINTSLLGQFGFSPSSSQPSAQRCGHRVLNSQSIRGIWQLRSKPYPVYRAKGFPHVWPILSVMAARRRAYTRLTRHSKTLIF